MPPSLSIIVPTYQRDQELRETLAALLAQADDATEIIVVDQSERHEPETTAFFAAHAGQIRRLTVAKPNLPNALNIGAAAARGEILLLVDDDIVPGPTLLAAHRAAFADPTVGIVAGRITDASGHVAVSERVGRIRRTGEVEDSFSATRATDADSARGCNLSVRRALFHAVGGFADGYLGTAVYNETDFCCRVRAHGWRIAFLPDAEVYHLRATRGGCRNRDAGSLRPRYSAFHNTVLFALRCLPATGVPLAVAVRTYEATRLAQREHRPAYALTAPAAAIHAIATWLRTGADRYPPPSDQTGRQRRSTEHPQLLDPHASITQG